MRGSRKGGEKKVEFEGGRKKEGETRRRAKGREWGSGKGG